MFYMKKSIDEYLFNEAIKYLGRYPATKKKIEDHLQKKIKNKKIHHRVIFPENIEKNILIENIISKLDELKIINESHYLETMFHYYQESFFSIRKIKNKLYQKGFDSKNIDEFISNQLQEDSDLELKILKKYVKKKRYENLEISELKKKLYQQNFSENSIYKLLKE